MDNMESPFGTYRRIFVLGSGFSKSFCPSMPTLRDLNAYIPKGIPDEFPHLRDYCRDFLSLCNGETDYLNIETLATGILSAQIFPGERERLYHASLRFELLRFIATVIRQDSAKGTAALPPPAAAILQKFLLSCVNTPRDRHTLFLSFNYDTLIEDMVSSSEDFRQISVDYGVRIDPADRSALRAHCENAAEKKSIDLIKLHGSLNWFPIKGSSNELDLRNVCQVEPYDRSFPIYREDTPIYIPMAHAKESFLRGSLFNLLWSKAEFFLKNAEEIHFVGYGFPKTDVNNLEFLLRHRDRIKTVVVWEEDNHPDLDRIRRLFGDKVVCKDAKTYIQGLVG